MPVLMTCPRDYTLRTTAGHVIHFKANEPTPVPESVYAEALSRNIVPAPDQGFDPDSTAGGKVRVQITGQLRDALVFGAIHEIVNRNNTEDFDGGRQPKVGAIFELSGVKLANQERAKYWEAYREKIGSNEELPSHPNVPLVQDLQALTTRKQLTEFAKDNGYETARLEGQNTRDMKETLLGIVINDRQAPMRANASSTLAND